jgi:DNA-binding beta-propeller fold protein YncE
VLGATYEAPGTAPFLSQRGLPTTRVTPSFHHEVELPADAGDTPVKAVQIINPETAEIVKTFNADGDGWDNGEGEGFSDGNVLWTVVVIERDGKRLVQVRTSYKNDFLVELTLCDRAAQPVTPVSAGSTNEIDRDAEYVGAIRIVISGWGGFRDYLQVRQVLLGLPDADLGLSLVIFTAAPGSAGWAAELTLDGFADSTQDLADMLPPGWMITPTNRKLDIRIPCPPPVLCTTTFDGLPMVGGGALHLLDAGTFTPIATYPLGGLSPFDMVLDPEGEHAFMAVPDQIQVLDLTAAPAPGQVLSLPGLAAIELAPTQEWVYAAGGQTFVALALPTGTPAWSVTLPGGPFNVTDLCVAPDGSNAYAGTDTGLLFQIDLLRQSASAGINVSGAGSIDVASDGQQVAVASPAEGGIRFYLPGPGSTTSLISTGLQPMHVVFDPLDRFALVANQGGNTVSFVDTQSNAVTQMTLAMSGPTNLAVFPDLGGNPVAVAVFDQQNQIQRFPLNPLAPPEAPQQIPPNSNLVRTNGQ